MTNRISNQSKTSGLEANWSGVEGSCFGLFCVTNLPIISVTKNPKLMASTNPILVVFFIVGESCYQAANDVGT